MFASDVVAKTYDRDLEMSRSHIYDESLSDPKAQKFKVDDALAWKRGVIMMASTLK